MVAHLLATQARRCYPACCRAVNGRLLSPLRVPVMPTPKQLSADLAALEIAEADDAGVASPHISPSSRRASPMQLRARVKEERDKEAVTSAYRPSTPRSEEHTLMPSPPRPPRDKVKGGDAATPPTSEAPPPHVSVQSDVSEDGTLVVHLF